MGRTYKGPNERMLSVLKYIEEFTSDTGYPPSYREICSGVDISTTSLVKYYIDRLRESGLLERAPLTDRGIPPGKKTIDPLPPMRRIPSEKVLRKRRLFAPADAITYFGGCAYCGTNTEKLQIDHFLPIVLGGSDDDCNILPACQKCNAAKSGSEPVSWVLKCFGQEALAKIIAYTHSLYKTKLTITD